MYLNGRRLGVRSPWGEIGLHKLSSWDLTRNKMHLNEPNANDKHQPPIVNNYLSLNY